MVYLVIAEEGKKRKLEFEGDFVFIGRGAQNQVQLKDPQVSEQHCQILRVDKGFRLLDLGSRTGTLVNGRKIQQVDLADGDIIQVGQVRMALKGVGPKAVPAQEKPVAAAAPSRSPGRRKSRKGRSRSRESLQIKEEFARASQEGGERLVRRNLRKGSKVPGWAQAVIGFWGLVALGFIVYFVFKQADSPYHDSYMEAMSLRGKGQFDAAIEILEKIPSGDADYGKLAREQIERMLVERDAGEQQRDLRAAKAWFENNIEVFIFKYLDAPPERKDLAKRIKEEYALFRKSYIRALIKRRIDPYREKYPNGEHIDEVNSLRRKYIAEIELAESPNFIDQEVEAETELVLFHYGEAYKLMDQWRKEHPTTAYGERIDKMLNKILATLRYEWEQDKPTALARESDDDPRGANSIYHGLLTRTEGYDIPEVTALRDYWQKKFDKNEARLKEKMEAAFGN